MFATTALPKRCWLLACASVLLAVPLPGSAVERECEGDLCIELERTEGGAVFFAINRQAAPASMVLEFPVLENMRVSVPLPLRTVVPPHSRERLLAIRSEDPSQSYRWRWSWSWTTGVLNASHDDDSRYLLPWSASHRFAVLQAAGGTLSHFGKARFAFDFRMPSDTLVVAARGGTVVRAVDHFRKGGLEERLKKRANAVFVLHEDGTIARYLHLRPGGALVEPGESLRAGEPIGRSGNTGYSQSPHLHFDVFAVDDELGWQTVPVRFADGTAQGLVPTPGALLYGGAR